MKFATSSLDVSTAGEVFNGWGIVRGAFRNPLLSRGAVQLVPKVVESGLLRLAKAREITFVFSLIDSTDKPDTLQTPLSLSP